jgi:hypothetical protein
MMWPRDALTFEEDLNDGRLGFAEKKSSLAVISNHVMGGLLHRLSLCKRVSVVTDQII